MLLMSGKSTFDPFLGGESFFQNLCHAVSSAIFHGRSSVGNSFDRSVFDPFLRGRSSAHSSISIEHLISKSNDPLPRYARTPTDFCSDRLSLFAQIFSHDMLMMCPSSLMSIIPACTIRRKYERNTVHIFLLACMSTDVAIFTEIFPAVSDRQYRLCSMLKHLMPL